MVREEQRGPGRLWAGATTPDTRPPKGCEVKGALPPPQTMHTLRAEPGFLWSDPTMVPWRQPALLGSQGHPKAPCKVQL